MNTPDYPQIPPERGPDDQQLSQPTTPDSNIESPPFYHSPSIPTTSHNTEELRCGTRIHNPCILPDNTYGDRAPIDIEHDIQIQPMNEDDDLGTMYV